MKYLLRKCEMCLRTHWVNLIASIANNKVPGYPSKIFNFVEESGSYLILRSTD